MRVYVVTDPMGFQVFGEEQWGVYRQYWGGRELIAWVPNEDNAYYLADLLEEARER